MRKTKLTTWEKIPRWLKRRNLGDEKKRGKIYQDISVHLI